MALQPVLTETSGRIPVFSKILEVLTGGFSFASVSGFNTNVILPAGSLIKVDEAARTATLIKTGVIYSGTSTTSLKVTPGHHFAAGDVVALGTGTGKSAHSISTITEGTDYDTFTIATAIEGSTGGAVLFEASAIATASQEVAVKTVANALTYLPVTIEAGGFVSALVRGTAYKNRIQANNSAHLADLPEGLYLSESY